MMKITPDRIRPALVARAYRQPAGRYGTTLAPARRWVTLQAAAEYTHLDLLTVRDMIARGTIRAFRLGRAIRVDLRALEKRNVARIPAGKTKAGRRLC